MPPASLLLIYIFLFSASRTFVNNKGPVSIIFLSGKFPVVPYCAASFAPATIPIVPFCAASFTLATVPIVLFLRHVPPFAATFAYTNVPVVLFVPCFSAAFALATVPVVRVFPHRSHRQPFQLWRPNKHLHFIVA